MKGRVRVSVEVLEREEHEPASIVKSQRKRLIGKAEMAKRISENLRTRQASPDDGKADMEARKWR